MEVLILGGGFFATLMLIAYIWAILNIVQSTSSLTAKVIWIAVILLFNFLGFLIWFFFGPREEKRLKSYQS